MVSAGSPTSFHLQRLDNGLTVVLEPMPWLPSVSFTLLLPLGSVTDPPGYEGSATVLHDWLQRGAGERDSRAFSDALDALGVRRGGSAGRETSTFTGSLLVEALRPTLELVADMLQRPRFDEDEFEHARALALQELASLDDSPTQKLFDILSSRFFRSPHRRSPYGTAEGLQALEPATVREDFAARFGPRGAILAFAGGIGWDELLAQVEATLGSWDGETVELPPVEAAPGISEHVYAEMAQVQIGLAFETIAPTHPDWYAQALAVQVLSGGAGSRLFTEVREKRGLVYSVAAMQRAMRDFGYLLGYAGTSAERADETLKVLVEEIGRLYQGISADELARARTGILSQLVMQGEASSARAGSLAQDVFFRGAPRTLAEIKDAINALTLAEVNDFLARQPAPQMTVLTLGARPLAQAG